MVFPKFINNSNQVADITENFNFISDFFIVSNDLSSNDKLLPLRTQEKCKISVILIREKRNTTSWRSRGSGLCDSYKSDSIAGSHYSDNFHREEYSP